MELTDQHEFLEELLLLQGSRRDHHPGWNTNHSNSSYHSTNELITEFFSNGWNLIYNNFDENSWINPPFTGLIPSPFTDLDQIQDQAFTFVQGLSTVPPLDPSYTTSNVDGPSFLSQDHHVHDIHPNPNCSDHDQGHIGHFLGNSDHHMEQAGGGGDDHMEQAAGTFEMGSCGDQKIKIKSKSKKLQDQPSKNLMAERRRRKRLNDRLSMLRSIVPKISKMDRTSILGDTIEYMKELLERIENLKEKELLSDDKGQNQIISSFMGSSKDSKPSEVIVRTSPKFDVAKREMETRIEISCGTRPGLLLSTVSTLEALGLEIQQGVISCFNDFSVQLSCSEGASQKAVVSSEDIKQELFRSAGYGGKCL